MASTVGQPVALGAPAPAKQAFVPGKTVTLAATALHLPWEATLAELLDVAHTKGGDDAAAAQLRISLQRRDALAPKLNCLINALPAEEVLAQLKHGPGAAGALAGIPFVVKDCIEYAGHVTTAGLSKRLVDHAVAVTDAPVIAAMKAAGAVCIGKANLPDLHLGLATTRSSFGPIVNPWSPPGAPQPIPAIGSSGGVAAAVAARICTAGIGVDTGGCLRIPTTLCGVCGFRPSELRYSSEGIFVQSITRDTPGPVARTVEDIQLLDAVLKGTAPHGAPPAPPSAAPSAAKPVPAATVDVAGTQPHAAASQGEGGAGSSGSGSGGGGSSVLGSIGGAIASAASKAAAAVGLGDGGAGSSTSAAAAGGSGAGNSTGSSGGGLFRRHTLRRSDFHAAELAGLRIGVPRKHYFEGLDPQLGAAVEASLELLRARGAVLVEGDFLAGHEPWELDAKVGQPIRAYEILREAARWGWEHGSRRSVVDLVEGFPGAPADKAMLQAALSGDPNQGTVPAWAYREALLIHRPRVQEAFADYFRRHGVECILYPTTPMPARPVSDEGTVRLNGADVPAYATYTRNTAPTSAAGLPAVSVPILVPADASSSSGASMPAGLEVAGAYGSDDRLLAIARGIQEALPQLPLPPLLATAHAGGL